MTFTQAFAAVEGAVILLGLWIVIWLLDVLAAQRKALTDTQVTLRLYRETRDQSDAQIRALLDQNERLARQLIDRAADATTSPVVRVTPTWFSEARES